MDTEGWGSHESNGETQESKPAAAALFARSRQQTHASCVHAVKGTWYSTKRRLHHVSCLPLILPSRVILFDGSIVGPTLARLFFSFSVCVAICQSISRALFFHSSCFIYIQSIFKQNTWFSGRETMSYSYCSAVRAVGKMQMQMPQLFRCARRLFYFCGSVLLTYWPVLKELCTACTDRCVFF